MDKYLFLDFDGVLNFSTSSMGECHKSIKNLSHICSSLNGLNIILSTTWRNHCSLELLKSKFPPNVAACIKGITPNIFNSPIATREREIELFFNFKNISINTIGWVALDDRKDLFTAGCENLVLVDSFNLLTPEDAQRAIENILKQCKINNANSSNYKG